ncbi:MAG TPA: metallophosphoesterase family protein [Caulobacteraceae bacterium]|nr:metallophosphoesterase family protein [Caulobacteraceae bacterium]
MDSKRRKKVAEELEAIFAAAGAGEAAQAPETSAPARTNRLFEAASSLIRLRGGRKRDLADPSTDGALVYAIGDVHGRYDLLKDLLTTIVHDYVARAKGRRPMLIFCGDYVDRGPDSAEVVEAVVWLKTNRRDIEVRALKGNHEQAMLAFIDSPSEGMDWLSYGGLDTLTSYGVRGSMDDERNRRQSAKELAAVLPPAHDEFLRNLELVIEAGDYAFVHAGIKHGRPLKKQKEEHLLWIREGFLDSDRHCGKLIVHGHTWVDELPQMRANRIGIDTGAYATGVLTALRLDGTERKFLHARRRPEGLKR